MEVAGLGEGINEGLKTFQNALVTRYQLQEQAKRTEAFLKSSTVNNKRAEIEIQRLKSELETKQKEQDKNDTFEAFKGFIATSDVTSLNNALKKSKNLNAQFKANGGNIFIDPDDLSEAKKKEIAYDKALEYMEYPAIVQKEDGSYGIMNMYNLMASSGYMSRMEKNERTKTAARMSELNVKEAELKVESAEEWLKANPTRTYQDYVNSSKPQTASQAKAKDFEEWKQSNPQGTFSEYDSIGKTNNITNASLKDEYANLKVAESNSNLSKDDSIRLKVLDRLFSTDNDEKRNIIEKGISITDKYKDNLFSDTTEITKDDIIDAKQYAQQAGIKPNAKANRDFKDQFNTVKAGRRLAKDVNALEDEEIARGIVDTGIQTLVKKFSDTAFNELSSKDKAKALDSIEMNTKLGMFLASYIKSISGTAVAQAEYDRLSGLFSGSNLDNTQSLKAGVTTFVDELGKNFENTAKTSLLDNTSTTLDLVKQYRELPELATMATDEPKFQQPTTPAQQIAVNPSTGEKLMLVDGAWVPFEGVK